MDGFEAPSDELWSILERSRRVVHFPAAGFNLDPSQEPVGKFLAILGPLTPPDPYPQSPVELASDGMLHRIIGPDGRGHFLEQTVVPLCVMQGSSVRPLGTAFAVAPDVWLTARHVVDDVTESLRRGTCSLLVAFRTASKRADTGAIVDGHLMKAAQYLSLGADPESHDLALISTNYTAEERELQASGNLSPTLGVIDLDFPTPGKDVVAYGFSGFEVEGDMTQALSEQNPITWRQAFLRADGRISTVHHPRRDAALLTWPVVESGSYLPSGMSGGPVLHGHEVISLIAGVTCTSVETADQSQSVAYASLLGPALDLNAYFGGRGGYRTSLRELVKRQIVISSGSAQLLADAGRSPSPTDDLELAPPTEPSVRTIHFDWSGGFSDYPPFDGDS